MVVAAPHKIHTYGFPLFIGSEEDVLDRYYRCALKYKADIIVRISADCPFLNSYVIDLAIMLQAMWKLPYMVLAPIDGWDVEVFTMKMLEKAWAHAISREDREHVTPYMKRYTKVSVDTQRDLERVKKIWSGKKKPYYWSEEQVVSEVTF